MPGRFSLARLRQTLAGSDKSGKTTFAKVAGRLFPDGLLKHYPEAEGLTAAPPGPRQPPAPGGVPAPARGASEVRLRARVPGLLTDAFATTPDPRYFFADARLRATLEDIGRALVERRGTVVLSGPAGSGKTTLLRYLGASWGHAVRFLAPALQLRTAADVLGVVMRALGLDGVAADRPHKTALARRELAALARRERRALAILIDDAHEMSVGALDQLGQLAAAGGGDDRPALQAVLAGRDVSSWPGASPPLVVAAQARLQAFAPDQVTAYVRHRLAVGGYVASEVFSDEALVLMGIVSAGRPRSINELAERALRDSMVGRAGEIGPIGADHVARAAVACGYGRIAQR